MKICHKYVKQQQNGIIFYNPYVLQERIKQYEKALSCYDDGQSIVFVPPLRVNPKF